MTAEPDAKDWPYTLNDPVRAVHFALEPDCPYAQPAHCPTEHRVAKVLPAYRKWLAHRAGYAATEEVADGGAQHVLR